MIGLRCICQYYLILKKLKDDSPFNGVKVAGCLHVTKETGVLIRTLCDLGADLAWCGCNPLSTQDDVAAALANEGISIFASRGVSNKQYYDDIHTTMSIRPNVTIDDGADLTVEMHNSVEIYQKFMVVQKKLLLE